MLYNKKKFNGISMTLWSHENFSNCILVVMSIRKILKKSLLFRLYLKYIQKYDWALEIQPRAGSPKFKLW